MRLSLTCPNVLRMTSTAARTARPLLGATLTFALLIGASAATVTPATSTSVNIYESEDLSDQPYSEPVTAIVVHHSAGSVCYADDRAKQDTRQLYVDCAAYVAAGGRIA